MTDTTRTEAGFWDRRLMKRTTRARLRRDDARQDYADWAWARSPSERYRMRQDTAKAQRKLDALRSKCERRGIWPRGDFDDE